jgi:hypothetical protein
MGHAALSRGQSFIGTAAMSAIAGAGELCVAKDAEAANKSMQMTTKAANLFINRHPGLIVGLYA